MLTNVVEKTRVRAYQIITSHHIAHTHYFTFVVFFTTCTTLRAYIMYVYLRTYIRMYVLYTYSACTLQNSTSGDMYYYYTQGQGYTACTSPQYAWYTYVIPISVRSREAHLRIDSIGIYSKLILASVVPSIVPICKNLATQKSFTYVIRTYLLTTLHCNLTTYHPCPPLFPLSHTPPPMPLPSGQVPPVLAGACGQLRDPG